MKSVGTITFHSTINYGGVLQAYALQQVLNEMGYLAENIDYFDHRRDLASLSTFRRMKHVVWHGFVKKLLVGSIREKRTEAFLSRHLRVSSCRYNDAASLHEAPPLYDAYITGSDQVWNARHNHDDSSYFLTFAPPGKKRVSYAASFGVSQIQDRLVSDYREWLKQIDCISTRELEGKRIIEQLTGREADITLDPTLLLNQEQWRQVAVPYESSKPYILCYYMPGDNKVNRSITEIASKIAMQTGWSVISIGQKEYMRLNPFRRTALTSGPAEFVGLFHNASFVVTNSFHGTAFSVNFKIPFLVPINRDLSPEKALSSRITTLLNTLKLENRLIPAGANLPAEDVIDLDFSSAERILQQEKQRSIDFLRNALGDA